VPVEDGRLVPKSQSTLSSELRFRALLAEGGAEEREGFYRWSAGAVRTGIEAIAGATDEDPEELLGVATESAKRDVLRKEQTAEQVERDLERMGRERLLPEEKILQKVSRYQAHLSRLMFKALH
jgi:hypothetical protein